MAHYIIKLSCLRRSINGRKQLGLEMSLKSRRGSHNLKFGGQRVPDAGDDDVDVCKVSFFQYLFYFGAKYYDLFF